MDNPIDATHHDSVVDDFGLFQIDTPNYDFCLSDFDQTLELCARTSQVQSSALLGSFDPRPPIRGKSRVSLACIACRSRHTKCDAKLPVCSQCRESNRSCSYAQSRRGRRLPRVVQPQEPMSEEGHSEMERPRQGSNQQYTVGSNGALSGYTVNNSLSFGQSPVSHSTSSSLTSEPEYSSKFLGFYYAFFHDAHPIVLPHRFLNQRLETNGTSLQHLLPAMEFIGSLFGSSATKEEQRARVESALLPDNLPATGFTVQTLLIFAIAVHACNEFAYARNILDHAVRIALEINMQSKSFSTANGEGCPVLEESWRRTWWFLYVTDGIFAGIRHCLTFSLFAIETDVDLPCEEAHYRSGVIPQPRTLEEYGSREFAAEELMFSSFTYLIDLGHILGVVLKLGTEPGEPFDPETISADISLMNWALYLPKKKQLVIETRGEVDEILFQAHMLCNTLKVYLHRPRSQLAYGPIERVSKCAPPPCEKSVAEQQRAFDFHTTKVLEAADAGIGLFTLPSPFITHTPLVICGLTLSILAQISACCFKLKGAKYTAARDRVRLGLRAIKTLGGVWTIGHISATEIQNIARESFSLQKSTAAEISDNNVVATPEVELI